MEEDLFFLVYISFQFLGHLLGFGVVAVPLEVELVLAQLMLQVLHLVLLLLHLQILLIILIALVRASSTCAMFLPGAKADPAELMGAHLAGHVVAALVLLDGLLALGAVLCERNHPLHVLTLVLVLLSPLLEQPAVSRLVELLPALEAE